MRIDVYHSTYGCDTGCCGHVIEMTKDNGDTTYEFRFTHDYDGEGLKFAQDLVRDEFGEEHVADLDWESCQLSCD